MAEAKKKVCSGLDTGAKGGGESCLPNLSTLQRFLTKPFVLNFSTSNIVKMDQIAKFHMQTFLDISICLYVFVYGSYVV